MMGKGGWEPLSKSCPNPGCTGELLAKALGSYLALRCTRRDFEKRGSAKEIEAWLEKNT